MGAPSTKALFRATKRKAAPDGRQDALFDCPPAPRTKPDVRRDDDWYPTGQPEAIRALLAKDGEHIRACGSVWENAVGDGALAREIEAHGLICIGSDTVDRGWPGTILRSFYDFDRSPARAIITNPPYAEINARDGKGRWLRHTLEMRDWDYCAMLLSWDWPAARQNGLGAMLDARPFSYCYLLRWKLDFTGEGSPPQRNAWFVWRKGWVGEPAFRWLDRVDGRQAGMDFGDRPPPPDPDAPAMQATIERIATIAPDAPASAWWTSYPGGVRYCHRHKIWIGDGCTMCGVSQAAAE